MPKNPLSDTAEGNFIEITEFRAIGSDALNWICFKRGKLRDGTGYSAWRGYSFHPELDGSISHMKKELLRIAGVSSFHGLFKAAEEIKELMDSKMTVDVIEVLGIEKNEKART